MYTVVSRFITFGDLVAKRPEPSSRMGAQRESKRACRDRFWETVLADPKDDPHVSTPNLEVPSRPSEQPSTCLSKGDGGPWLGSVPAAAPMTLPSHENGFDADQFRPGEPRPWLDTAETLSKMKELAIPVDKPRMPLALQQVNCEKPYSCNEDGCTATFSHVSSKYRHHRTVHLRRRDHLCDVPGCGLAFGERSGLTKHTQSVHTKIRKFSCSWAGCDHRFSFKLHAKMHYSTVRTYDANCIESSPLSKQVHSCT